MIEITKKTICCLKTNDERFCKRVMNGYTVSINEDVFKILHSDFANYTEFKKYINEKGLDENNFYFICDDVLPRIFYMEDDYIYIEILGNMLNKDILEFMQIEKRVKMLKKIYKECIEKGDYISIYSFLDKAIYINYFLTHWSEIPDNEFNDIFKHVYCSLEYNHQQLFSDEDIVKRLIQNKEDMEKEILKMNTKIIDGKITVYRGETSHSTHYNDVDIVSWTLDLKVAEFFANRFRGRSYESRIYKSEVSIKDLLLVDMESNEKEVLVFSKDLQNIERIK